MLVLKRKNMVLGVLVLLLVIAGYLNFFYNQNTLDGQKKDVALEDSIKDKATVTVKDAKKDIDKDSKDITGESSDAINASSTSSFFVEYRFDRENSRKKEIEYIQDIVENPKSEVEMKNEAQAQLLELASNMEKELNIEGLLKAKGFKDSIVIFNKDYVSVIVEKSELVSEEVAQILDIVKRESGKAAENIKIIPTSQ